jgi:hypothetical protein
MQEPTEDEDDEASVSTENAREDPNLNDTFVVRRKAGKRTLPWDLAVDELEIVSPQQAEDIRATKRPRLDEPSSASTCEAATPLSSQNIAVSLPAADVDADHADADADPVKGARATGYWTSEEDAKLNSVVTNTSKKKWCKEYKTDWAAVAALVPSRITVQCCKRWKEALDPNMDQSNRRTSSSWSEYEDIKLKDAVQTHGGKCWEKIAVLVPGRTKKQCNGRWHAALVSNIDPATARAGKWTVDEDKKLKDAVQMHGGKDWAAVCALVPGRTKNQCRTRWHGALVSNIDPTMAHAGKWTADEDKKLKGAVLAHGGKNWGAISALVPGRTIIQCCSRSWYPTSFKRVDARVAG